MLIELFADQPQTTIASGGTNVPAPGTTQTLTPVSGTGFPAVSAASNSQFHIADPAAPSELIAVTQTGAAWTVTRGAEGATPVSHQAGWTARQVVTAGMLGSMAQAVDAKAFGAKGDGATDDTSALAAWIDAINQASGTFAVLPPGRYMISGPLPKILAKSVVIVGCGWSYADSRYGSVIALSSYNPNSSSSPMLWLDGVGNRLEGICVDGGGYASTVISVTGGHTQLTRVQARHAAADGTCIAIGPGGDSCWITDSVINGYTTSGNIGVSLDGTDAIIEGCKWDNDYVCLEMLARAGGAQIIGCHFTPGCPGDSTPVNIAITNCLFQSKRLTHNTCPLVAVDTTTHSVNGLSITNNACYGDSAHLPKYFLAAQTQDGARPQHPEKLASAGCLCAGNNAWVGTSFYAADSTPTVGRGNVVTTDGSSYSAVPDI